MTARVLNRGKGESPESFDEHNPDHVYIGRRDPWGRWEASKWANPFIIGDDGTRDEVIAKFRAYLLARPDLLAALPELKGKTLFCWCKPDACHGDVLAELSQVDGPATGSEGVNGLGTGGRSGRR